MDCSGWAGAGVVGVVVISARAWVHGGDESEGGGVFDGEFGAGYGDAAVFEGLAEDFEDGAFEFG